MSEFPTFSHNRENRRGEWPDRLKHAAELNNEQVEQMIELIYLFYRGETSLRYLHVKSEAIMGFLKP